MAQPGVAFLLCALVGVVASMGSAEHPVLRGTGAAIDGDTLTVAGVTVRLLHIDAPETGQPFGPEATDMLATLVAGAPVVCRGGSDDPYGRRLAKCTASGRDLAAEMAAQGGAAVFRRYGDTHSGLEAEARRARRGLWAAPDPVMPWDYRAARWEAVSTDPPRAECPIKGNISRGRDRIYHAPWSRWYDRTRIDASRGERWFCDEAEARAAGWRAPGG